MLSQTNAKKTQPALETAAPIHPNVPSKLPGKQALTHAHYTPRVFHQATLSEFHPAAIQPPRMRTTHGASSTRPPNNLHACALHTQSE